MKYLTANRLVLLPITALLIGFIFASPVRSQSQLPLAGLPGQESYYNYDLLAAYYGEHDMQPVWIRGAGSFQPRVEAVIKILEDSWTHGLNAEHYRVSDIKQKFETLNADNRMQLDLLISDAVIKYVSDLSNMRGQSESMDRKIKFWREPIDKAAILTMVAGAGDPIVKLREFEPGYALYQSLRQELIRLAALPAEKYQSVKIKGLVKPGKSYVQMPAIRAKMGLPVSEKSPQFYEEALAVEVIKLQKAYGLDPDGVIGPQTMELINITNHDKMMQIVANMERMRWISQGRPDRYVLVNIPSASLWAVDGGEVKLTMPVIVGKTARPTYSFKTEITGVRFNPNWTVPPTIKSKDFLPALQKDPYALSKRGIQLASAGSTIDPGMIDWNNISSRELHSINMVQDPGDGNPLGKVRVIMENPYNIYLHDTNHRDLFDKKERNLSSGCIRLSQPEKLADFLLSHNENWSTKKMNGMIASGKMRDIKTDQPIPVFITYQTIWLDTDGRLIYGRDVYGQDKKLAKMLEKAGAIHIPGLSQKKEISL